MNYDRRQLNEFIIKHFTDEELRILCAVEFRSVYHDFSDGWGKKRKVLELIGWCERNAQEDKLLTILQRERSRPFRAAFGRTNVQTEIVTVPVGQRNPRQIFISHAHQDAELAQRLAADLRDNGWQTWIAPDSIHPGEQWVEAINRGLEESGIFIVLLTPEAVRSKWVKRETNVALSLEHEGELTFYPLDVKSCRPPALWRGYQFVPFQNDYLTDVARLLRLLAGEEIASQPAQPKVEAKPAPVKTEKPKPSPARIDVQPREKPQILIPTPPDIRVHPNTGKEMIRIPAGDFLYGEKKERRHLPEFWIAKTPVTNEEYARFVAATGHNPPSHWDDAKSPFPKIADHPVVYVSWHDAEAYANWASCQLPTEEEWEKAARGIDGREYPWGNDWQEKHCNSKEAGIGTTSPVEQFSPQGDSPYSCVDMSGNVWEWTASKYRKDKDWMCLRGGAFLNDQWLSRAAYRGINDPGLRDYAVGFRVAEHLSISGS
ncbi:SUMF1/EgtB/PvdO family nonheme iron enzyme [Candidatus Leptofilum sp.]|uniref:SUMF1/EgtB/PvdO family nonheme iron enzyme n=1 Tax=Candidatus Leptofilum sp. TaxID=3241576 RepID=UPI003B5ACED5